MLVFVAESQFATLRQQRCEPLGHRLIQVHPLVVFENSHLTERRSQIVVVEKPPTYSAFPSQPPNASGLLPAPGYTARSRRNSLSVSPALRSPNFNRRSSRATTSQVARGLPVVFRTFNQDTAHPMSHSVSQIVAKRAKSDKTQKHGESEESLGFTECFSQSNRFQRVAKMTYFGFTVCPVWPLRYLSTLRVESRNSNVEIRNESSFEIRFRISSSPS